MIYDYKYKDYQQALDKIGLETLAERRENLCNFFVKKQVSNVKVKNHFRRNVKPHRMDTRNPDICNVNFATTERLKISPVIYMQNLLNDI